MSTRADESGERRPTGTVTFLFSDIEGSTQLWEKGPSAMAEALEEHDRIMRNAIDAEAGFVFATGGDGFCVAFHTAGDAVAAAVEAQRRLRAQAWPQGCEIRVRMGLHCGQAIERAGDYFGPAVNLAARVMAAGHGGQVLCSRPVAALTEGLVSTRSLGDHQLRGLAAAVEIHQVLADDLDDDFGPLRTVNVARTNLPHAAATPVGRDAITADVISAVHTARVVTLTGVGGVGKTTLALTAGRELVGAYSGGVWLCELAATNDAGQLFDTLATALRFTPPSGATVQDALAEFLAGRALIVVLDNCEHIVDAAADAAEWLLRSCPDVRILATSREPLHVTGERVIAVPPLDIPSGDLVSDVVGSPAGSLFVAKSTDVNARWQLNERNAAAVAGICRKLDGIPLAVEIAAARSATLDANDIAGRLGARLDLLTRARRTGEPRHQTLRTAIEWSYELLDEPEQWLFRRLSVFVDGFDVDAVVAIGAERMDESEALDVFASVVAKSLVELDRRTPGRYRLLETIRRFAQTLSGTDRHGSATNAHARHYVNVCRSAFEELRVSDGVDATERLAADAANIETAMAFCAHVRRADEALALFLLLPAPFFLVLPVEVTERLTRALEKLLTGPGAAQQAGFSAGCAAAGWMLGDAADRDRWSRIAQARAQVSGDAHTALFDSNTSGFRGDMAQGAVAAGAGLALLDTDADPLLRATLLSMLAIFEESAEPSTGLVHAEQAVALSRAHGGSFVLPYALLALAMCTRSDVARCSAAANEARLVDRTVRRTFSSTITMLAAHAAATAGDLSSAVPLLRASIAQIGRSGNRQVLGITVGTAADAIVGVAPDAALDLACIAESGAISPVTILDNPGYTQLRSIAADVDPNDLAARRAHFGHLSYDDAVSTVLDILDNVIAQQLSAE